MVCEINYGVMKFSELLFGQIAARLIITFYYISERTVKISRENIDQRPVSSRFRAHFSLLLLKRHWHETEIVTHAFMKNE